MNLLPLNDARTLGAACRLRRKFLGLTLQDAAGAAGVNYRFASELERGKPTCALGLALKYAGMLGVELFYEAGTNAMSPPDGNPSSEIRP
jgi:transcriptional regulator with XRE-family HTH domain